MIFWLTSRFRLVLGIMQICRGACPYLGIGEYHGHAGFDPRPAAGMRSAATVCLNIDPWWAFPNQELRFILPAKHYELYTAEYREMPAQGACECAAPGPVKTSSLIQPNNQRMGTKIRVRALHFSRACIRGHQPCPLTAQIPICPGIFR
jgi:hypothetical protein